MQRDIVTILTSPTQLLCQHIAKLQSIVARRHQKLFDCSANANHLHTCTRFTKLKNLPLFASTVTMPILDRDWSPARETTITVS